MSWVADVMLTSKYGNQVIATAAYDDQWVARSMIGHHTSHWRKYWTRLGPACWLRIKKPDGSSGGCNCIYCGDPIFDNQSKCSGCWAKPDADPDDFGYDPTTGWVRGHSIQEQEKLTKARHRISDNSPPNVFFTTNPCTEIPLSAETFKMERASSSIREQMVAQLIAEETRRLNHAVISSDAKVEECQNWTYPGINVKQENVSRLLSLQGQRVLRRERSSEHSLDEDYEQ